MMAVITISREYGSGGDLVAAGLCEKLGYVSFGKEQIAAAAQDTTISKSNVVDYTEDNHEVQTFLDRLFGRTASSVQTIAWTEDPSIATRPERADVHEEAVISLVRRAIKAAVRQGNMVIVGRGGQVLLKDTPGVLHVRLEAPIDSRLKRVSEQIKQDLAKPRADLEVERMASDIIVNRDISSADYIRKYYNADWADAKLYHLVLNLGQLSPDQAVQIILAAVGEIEKAS
jgi:CMP/dCMP kinase